MFIKPNGQSFSILNNRVTFPAITSSTHQSKSNTNEIIAGGTWSLLAIRTNIRNNFPRAKEGKRIKVHGWLKRMSTPSGRRILMRRILRGKHVLSH